MTPMKPMKPPMTMTRPITRPITRPLAPPAPSRPAGARLLPAARNRGFSLVEVLVAITIFAIGFLALAGMQVSGLRATQISNYRSLAMFHAQTIADQMRANRTMLQRPDNPYYSAPAAVGPATPSPEEQRLVQAQDDLDKAQRDLADAQGAGAELAAAQAECTTLSQERTNLLNALGPSPSSQAIAEWQAADAAATVACDAKDDLANLPPADIPAAQAAVSTATAELQSARQAADAAGFDSSQILNDLQLQQAAATVSTCTAVICTAEELARFEIQHWRDMLAASLPGGQGIVCIDDTPDDGDPSDWMCDSVGEVAAIKLSWLEQASAGELRGGTLVSSQRQRLVVRLARL